MGTKSEPEIITISTNLRLGSYLFLFFLFIYTIFKEV